MNQLKNDIQTRQDITLLINEFYKTVREDQLLAPHFTHIDWEHHTPIIINFWCMILLGEQSYKDNPFARHLKLSLQKEDFQRWLFHFTKTIDAHFKGEKAEEAKQRALSIASVFQFKMGLMQNQDTGENGTLS
jgi:hemoglobin